MNNKFTHISSLTSAPEKKQGSTIVMTLFFTLAVSMISVSFLSYAMTDYKLEKRTHENTRLLYLAEGGADRAVWSIQNDDWSTWSQSDSGKDMYHHSYQNTDGRMELSYLLVKDFATEPVIFSEAVCVYGKGTRQSKQVRVRYNLGGGIGAGIIARNNLIFKNDPMISAYDSALGPPSLTNQSDEVIAATVSDEDGKIILEKKSSVYGYLATGGGAPSIAAGSSLTGEDTEDGVIVDQDRISNDFTYDFPEPLQPDWHGAINTLNIGPATTTIGIPNSRTLYRLADQIKLSGSSIVEVAGPVQMYLENGLKSIGTSHFRILPGGSLEIFTPADVSVLGTGFVNVGGSPEALKLYGTSSTSQIIEISGTGDIEGVIYAPNADVTLGGTGGLLGSLTGNNITFSAQGSFTYDTQLAGAGDKDIGITSWHEMIKASDRFDIKGYLTGQIAANN